MKRIAYILAAAFISLTACKPQEPQVATVMQLEELSTLISTKPQKVQVINFWATWCQPCVEELPAFEKVQKEHSDEVDVTLISLDNVEDLDTKVNPFLLDNKIQSQVRLLDHPYAAEFIPVVDNHWDGAIPVTLIFSDNKRQFYNKALTHEELEDAINLFL